MTQTVAQRRFVRLAGTMNAKARLLGVRGRVTAEDLGRIALRQPSCTYCKVGLAPTEGGFDHALPWDRGGTNEPANIVRSCLRCNRRKFTKTPEELAEFEKVMVTCRRPGCGNVFKPRYAEWKNGRATVCSLSCAAKLRKR